MKRAGWAASFIAVAAVGPAYAQDAAPPPVVRALTAPGPIRLDGVLDEAAWSAADSIAGLTQRDPDEGAPSPFRTVVRFLAAPDGLYVGVWAYDPAAPGGIRRTQLRRDGDMDSDDFIAVMIDAQRDRRSGFLFGTNPNGAMWDAEVVNQETFNEDWNGVWDVRARAAPGVWTAELLIPWQALRYPAGARAFGVNVVRYARRRNEESLWTSWRRQQGLGFQENEGTLLIERELPGRGMFEVRPYAAARGDAPARTYDTAGADSVTAQGGVDARAGLDAKLAVAPTLTLDLTINTDFAQVEADRQVVNLSRFPVFFPEKRQFFLESANLFQLGQSEQTQLFHSRRIGLSAAGAVVPIVAGARVFGRMGRDRVGLLAVRTGGDEQALDIVARVQHDVFTRGYIGAMATGRGGPGVAGEALAGGLDFRFPLLWRGQNVIPVGFFAGSKDPGGGPWRSAWRLFLDYPNDWADNFVSVARVDSGFDPALGFVRQDGIWRYQGAVRVFPRPHRWGIRRFAFTLLQADVTTTLAGDLSTATYEVRPIGIEFDSGDEVELRLNRELDVPADSFELFPGSAIAPGRYGWNRAELEFGSADARPVVVSVEASIGDFYTGAGEELQWDLGLRLAPHVVVGVEGDVTRVRLAGSGFTAHEHRLRLDYAATPQLNTTLFVQWDNESERLAVNARLHWIPRPGSDAYVVWSSAWPSGLARGIPWRRPLGGGLVGKLVYYLRR